jgi:hypothetical protein
MRDSILKYGIRNGIEFHISEVESGLICNCTCPACGERLIAKKGENITPHFAHESKQQCEHAYETSLHYDAKRIIEEEKRIILPSRKALFDTSNLNGFYFLGFDLKNFGKIDSRQYKVDNVILEKKLHNIIPDIECTINGGIMLIEIAVTSKVQSEKQKKIQEIGLPVIEIDLSKLNRTIEKEELAFYVLDNIKNKTWFENKEDDELIEILKQKHNQIWKGIRNHLENKLIKGSKNRPHINECPRFVDRAKNKRIDLYECEKCSCNLARHEFNILCGYSNYKRIIDIIKEINEEPRP